MKAFVLAATCGAAIFAMPIMAATVPVVVQATPALAPQRQIVISAEGSVKVMPDTAIVSGGVVAKSRRAADALKANQEAILKSIAALKALGIADAQIATARVHFEPQYEHNSKGQIDPDMRVIGYTVTNRITVTLKDKLDKAGEAFDALIQNGANDSATVNFELRDTERFVNEARAEAGRKALAAAQIYAKAIGTELVAVLQVRESGTVQVLDQITAEDIGALPDRNTAEALQRVPGIAISPITAEEQTIRKTVTVTWALK